MLLWALQLVLVMRMGMGKLLVLVPVPVRHPAWVTHLEPVTGTTQVLGRRLAQVWVQVQVQVQVRVLLWPQVQCWSPCRGS